MKHYLLTIVIFLTLLYPGFASGEVQTLNIIYTGSLNGELEPCGCAPATDFGGLARLSGYIREHEKDLTPYLLLDAGNFTQDDSPQGRLKVNAMLNAFRIMGYSTIALQKNEKDFPEDFITPVVNESGLTAISGMKGYSESVSQKHGGVDIHMSTNRHDRREHMLNILLTDLEISECETIQGWDIIISSSGDEIQEPLYKNNTIITSGFLKGEKVGMLAIKTDREGNISGFSHRWQPLGNDIKEDSRVRESLNEYDIKVAELLKKRDFLPPGTTYLGVSKCAECHQLYVEYWEDTRHADAFASLEHTGKSSDPECLVCHTVGFGQEGGFHTIETTPGLANVQCEVCHGLDREHITDFSRPMRPVSESICLTCHTKSNSPDFNYLEYFDKIKH